MPQLIKAAKPMCSLSPEEMREYRGTLTEPGKDSPYRMRSVAENLDLFERMRTGEFPEGAHTLRAKIDMASGNLNMRDPVMYRILHASHHHAGDTCASTPCTTMRIACRMRSRASPFHLYPGIRRPSPFFTTGSLTNFRPRAIRSRSSLRASI